MSEQSRNKLFARIPLRIVLVAPFVAQIVLAVGLVGYLSFWNGRRAVDNVARQLQSEITARIEEHLDTFLSTPHQITQVNANAIRQGLLDVDDPDGMERHFWGQIQVFDSVTSTYFGYTTGGFVGAGREGAGGSLYTTVTDEFSSSVWNKYATDGEGNRTGVLTTIPNFDARTRPWYTGALEKGGAVWSDVYILFSGQDLAIAASRPVYDKEQNLLGVASIDIFISHLRDFIKTIEIGETGSSFIMERSGLLVASSTDENPFTDPDGDQAQRRLYASESQMPAIRQAAEFLSTQFDDYDAITAEQYLEFEIEEQRQFLQVSPIRDEYGIDWLIVVVAPESDFMAQIETNNRTTVFLIVAALAVAIVVGLITARRITDPILRLIVSAQALAKGEWEQTTGVNWIGELDELTRSFDSTAGQLRQTVENLTSEIAERKRAEESLRESEEKFRSLAENSQDYIMRYDEECRHVYENPAALRVSGLSEKDIIGKTHREAGFDAELSDVWEEKITRVFKTGQAAQTIFDWEGAEGKVYLDWRLFPEFDASGKVKTVLGVSRDITEIKQAEEQIKASLREKEVLLRELYHRTKNNMAVISSLLALQAEHIQDEFTLHVLREMENRIQTMALVHQRLYQAQDLSSIDLHEYVADLAHLAFDSYNITLNQINLILDLEDMFVLIDVAIPCGLVLNELLSNALKHAFPGDRKGEVCVRIRRAEPGVILLQVSDDGVGIPQDFDFRQSDTLGMQTVLGVTEHQLGGTVTVDTSSGVTWHIRFRDDLYSSRV